MIIQFLGVLLKNDWLVEIAYNLRINSHCMVKYNNTPQQNRDGQ